MNELDRYLERTPRSRALQQRGARVMPLGVESNFRFFDPYPIFLERASGSRVWDADGHEYIDFALSFGALMVGHAHPAVVRAIERQVPRGIMFGMPNPMMLELAEELTHRFGIDRIRFANSGTEATMHAIRVARGSTGREKSSSSKARITARTTGCWSRSSRRPVRAAKRLPPCRCPRHGGSRPRSPR